ncbi:zinc finger protein [Wuchereria bancrofti]|uniref:Zinc finger protein n=1 Tax=Wuchereria bancrofti TaxID=6293 RepID=J9EPB2_WUCBA|nr:zinc finger protein [Wuchereria bancrofti]
MEENQDLQAVFNFLRREPVMFQALQRFVVGTIQFERSLMNLLDEVQRKLDEMEGQNAHEEMEESAVSQEPGFDEEEAERAPLPETDDDDDAESWLHEAELAPLPSDEDEEPEPEVQPEPMDTSGTEEPVESVRELVLRTRTIKIPVLATQEVLAAVTPEEFHPADLGDLPEQLRRSCKNRRQNHTRWFEKTETTTSVILCGICSRQFGTLKGWRIHASRMHKQDGFCARCGHNLLLPPGFTAAQITAAVELHALEWCPRACAAVISERQANNNIWHSSRGEPVAACSNSPSNSNEARPRGLVDTKNF